MVDPHQPAVPESAPDGNLSQLEARYAKLPAPEPPELVDLAIRNMARRAVARPSPTRWRWVGAAAALPVALLAVHLTLNRPAERQAPAPSPPLQPGTPSGPQAAPTAASRPAAESGAARMLQSGAMERRGESLDKDEPAESPAAKAVQDAADAALELEQATPRAEDWLDRIRAQLDSGDRDGAEQELKRFRQAYPDYPVPPDLGTPSAPG